MGAAVGKRSISRWLGVLVLLPVLTFVVATFTHSQSTATLEFRLLVGTTDPQAFPVPVSAHRLTLEADLAEAPAVLDGTCRRLPSPPPDGSLLSVCASLLGRQVQVTTDASRGFVRVAVRADSQQVAATRVRAFSRAFLAVSAAVAKGQVNRAVARVRAASPRRRLAAAVALGKLATGLTSQTLVTGPFTSSGHPLVATLIAAALAILIALALLVGRRPELRGAPARGSEWDDTTDEPVESHA